MSAQYSCKCRLSCNVSAQLPLVKAAVRSVATCYLICDRISLVVLCMLGLQSVSSTVFCQLGCDLLLQLRSVSLAVVCQLSCHILAQVQSVLPVVHFAVSSVQPVSLTVSSATL